MSHTVPSTEDFRIDPHQLYDLHNAAPRVGLSIWHLRHKSVTERKVAFLRHTPNGKILFHGRDLIAYLETCRQPAVGERGRRAAQAAVAAAGN